MADEINYDAPPPAEDAVEDIDIDESVVRCVTLRWLCGRIPEK